MNHDFTKTNVPSDVGAYAKRTALNTHQSALASGGTSTAERAIVGVGGSPEDFVVTLRPLYIALMVRFVQRQS